MEENKNVDYNAEIKITEKELGPRWFPTLGATATGSIKIASELTKVKNYLRTSGLTFTPDALKEHLGLKQSAATLSRKFRDASVGENPELVRSYYVNDKGRRIAEYRWNPEHKEGK